ncbi:hypothetical protein [Phormidium sp. CCY1219]|uniref:hypothetical protein n=1 Tax=Phormidium sp. CCY1219 TaxID=2886104 RepID=UPI002D1E69C8|nr:hypothetical protein [Phormidium sp. CCY1219]MEB3830793.1 hypothetical protein [Phormidium sp. CCY1219]
MQFDEARVDENASSIYFVYPFTFDIPAFDSLNRAIADAKLPQKQTPLWTSGSFPTEDLLFHVANYLNPTDDRTPTAQLWELSDSVRDVFGFREQWELISPQESVPFGFGKDGNVGNVVQLMLFQVGVGFLILQVQPTTNTLQDWLNFLHYFRFLEGQQGSRVRAQKRLWDAETNRPLFEDYFPEIADRHAQGKPKFGHIVKALLHTVSSQRWWNEIFVRGQMLPFVSLYVDGLSEEKTPHLLYKLQNFFHANQGEDPAPEDLDPQVQPWLPYARGQWFVCTLEGSSFLAVNASTEPFFRATLPSHLRQQYFLLFLLALHQRFALMSLSEQVAESWVRDEATRLQEFDLIRDRLLWFTARGYFAQVMQRKHHHRCYCKWQEVFQLDRLYREVHDEVREMQEYSTLQYLRRLEAAEKQREQQRLEEKERQAAAEKKREQQRLEDLRRQEERERERDRLYMLALREKEEADKQRERQYLQQLREKDEAQAKRDRELQDLAYIISAGLGGAAIVASSAGLLTAGSNNGEITVGWIPDWLNALHPVSASISLSLLAALLFGFAGWGVREFRRRRSDRIAQRKLEAFRLLLERYPAWFSWRDREWLGELVDCKPNEPRELWEAIASWCESERHPLVVKQLTILEKRVKLHRKVQKNYKAELRSRISPPTAAQKKIEGFLQLLHNQPHLFDAEARSHLAEQNWSAEPEKLAEQISKWCKRERRSAIYAQLLEEQNNLPSNLPISQMDRYSDRLQKASNRLLKPPKPPSLGLRVLQESWRELEQGWQRLKRSPPP